MQSLALEAYTQESTEIRGHPILMGFLECTENIQVRFDLRMKLGHADITLDKALERALNIEAVKRIEEEDSVTRFSAILSNEKTQLVKSINILV